MTQPVDIDSHGNDDWLRRGAWDIWSGEKLVETLPELMIFLQADQLSANKQKVALENFMGLPAARPMPASLRDAAHRFLGD